MTVTDDEMQRAIYDQVRQHPGQEQQIMDYLRQTPEAVAQMRAPIFEEKVIDHIIGEADVTDKTVSKEELDGRRRIRRGQEAGEEESRAEEEGSGEGNQGRRCRRGYGKEGRTQEEGSAQKGRESRKSRIG